MMPDAEHPDGGTPAPPPAAAPVATLTCPLLTFSNPPLLLQSAIRSSLEVVSESLDFKGSDLWVLQRWPRRGWAVIRALLREAIKGMLVLLVCGPTA